MGRFIQNGTGVVVSVDDSKDERFSSGWKPYTGEQPKSATPDKSWNLADLKAHAVEKSVDLGSATKKDEILAAIVAASTPPAN